MQKYNLDSLTPTSNIVVNDEEYNEIMKINNKDVSIDDIGLKCSNIPDSFFKDAVRMFEESNINEQ